MDYGATDAEKHGESKCTAQNTPNPPNNSLFFCVHYVFLDVSMFFLCFSVFFYVFSECVSVFRVFSMCSPQKLVNSERGWSNGGCFKFSEMGVDIVSFLPSLTAH